MVKKITLVVVVVLLGAYSLSYAGILSKVKKKASNAASSASQAASNAASTVNSTAKNAANTTVNKAKEADKKVKPVVEGLNTVFQAL